MADSSDAAAAAGRAGGARPPSVGPYGAPMPAAPAAAPANSSAALRSGYSDATHEALNHELAWLKRANKVLTGAVLLGGQRYKGARTELSQAEAQTAAATRRIDDAAVERLDAAGGVAGPT